jgi:hypothetical protein
LGENFEKRKKSKDEMKGEKEKAMGWWVKSFDWKWGETRFFPCFFSILFQFF